MERETILNNNYAVCLSSNGDGTYTVNYNINRKLGYISFAELWQAEMQYNLMVMFITHENEKGK